MKKLLLTFLISTPLLAGAESQPVPPVLPPYNPSPAPVIVEPTTTKKVDEATTCVGRIVCECGGVKTKEVVKWKTKTVEVVKWKTKEVVKWKTKEVEKPVVQYVDREKVVEKIVEKQVPATEGASTSGTHTFSVLAGAGPTGVYMDLYDTQYRFRNGYGAVGGAMYQYGFANGFGLGLGYITSDTWLGAASLTIGKK